jgi:hypothetical protein
MCRYHVQGRQVITVVVRLGVAALIALVLGHRRAAVMTALAVYWRG